MFTSWKQNRQTKSITDQYTILGFISSGTYGRVYKAVKTGFPGESLFAVKKFKPDKPDGGDANLSTGLSQSAVREIGICREIRNVNIVNLESVFLGAADRSIYMVFDYAEVYPLSDYSMTFSKSCITILRSGFPFLISQ